MRLLNLIASVDARSGGPFEVVRQLYAPLTQANHAVDTVCVDGPSDNSVRDAGFPVIALGPAQGGYRYARLLLPWLRAHARDYDAVVVHGIWQHHSLAAWRALGGSDVPYYVFTHGMLDPWFKRTYPLKHLKKWLYWPWAEYRVLRDARAVIFTCEEEKLLARQSFWLYRCREQVVTCGIAPPPLDHARQLDGFFRAVPRARGQRILLFLGRIHPKKGCDNLIDAFADIARTDRSLCLVMAGPDQVDWARDLKRQAQERGIPDRVLWPGMLLGDLKWGAFQAAAAFVLPSHQENFGIAVTEALACGKPVLISNRINIWREIDSDAAGLVEADTLDGTRRLLARWHALEASEAAAMAFRARTCFERRFSVDQAAQNLIAAIRRTS